MGGKKTRAALLPQEVSASIFTLLTVGTFFMGGGG